MGRVRSWAPNRRPLIDLPYHPKVQVDKAGYHRISINGKKMLIHRMVALAFFGPPVPGQEVHHENKERGDNRVANLRYVTKQENLALRRKRDKLKCPHCDGELW
jgi:hypothetical protein